MLFHWHNWGGSDDKETYNNQCRWSKKQLPLITFVLFQHQSRPRPSIITLLLGMFRKAVFIQGKRLDIWKENKDLKRWRWEQTRRRRSRRRWGWFGSISAGPQEMWQSATLLKHLLISMTQLSQPYFSKIKRPYGKRAGPRGKGRGGDRSARPCLQMNKLVVCRCSSGSLLPPFGSPLSSTLPSFDMIMAPNWWRHFSHPVTTQLASDINTSSTPPRASIMAGTLPPALSSGTGQSCLIS